MFVFCDPVLPSSAPVCALGHLPPGEGFFAKQQFIAQKEKPLPVREGDVETGLLLAVQDIFVQIDLSAAVMAVDVAFVQIVQMNDTITMGTAAAQKIPNEG